MKNANRVCTLCCCSFFSWKCAIKSKLQLVLLSFCRFFHYIMCSVLLFWFHFRLGSLSVLCSNIINIWPCGVHVMWTSSIVCVCVCTTCAALPFFSIPISVYFFFYRYLLCILLMRFFPSSLNIHHLCRRCNKYLRQTWNTSNTNPNPNQATCLQYPDGLDSSLLGGPTNACNRKENTRIHICRNFDESLVE